MINLDGPPAGRMPGRRTRVASAVVALFSVFALSIAVGPGSARAQTTPSAADAKALLPDDTKKSGVIKAAMPLDFEPYNFLDDKSQQVGFDVEIFHAIADVLGVKPEIDRLAFASIIPAVSGGREDVGMSVMAILPERLKQISFVRYSILANALVVRKGNPSGIRNDDACGHSIAVEKGTQPVIVWEKKSKECEDAGKKKIDLTMFDGKGPQVLAVETGRADGAGVSFATAIVSAKHSDGKLEAAPGGPVPGATVDAGIGFKKGNTQLGKAIEAALKVIVADGTYKKIMDKWDLAGTQAEPKVFEEQ
ncbi:MAG TPA: ABC transporter substrate-binding protein [Stellaceae bacterium]|nr:ABC transporter substrate-binding protein [Stellaceae bacterium]